MNNDNWKTDIERFLQSTSASSLWIHDLLVKLVKIRNKNVVKITLNTNACMWNHWLCYFYLNLKGDVQLDTSHSQRLNSGKSPGTDRCKWLWAILSCPNEPFPNLNTMSRMYISSCGRIGIVNEKYIQFVTFLQQNNINNKCDAIKTLDEICEKKTRS